MRDRCSGPVALKSCLHAAQACEAAMAELEEEQALLQALSEDERELGDSLGDGGDATPGDSPPEHTSILPPSLQAPRGSPPKLR